MQFNIVELLKKEFSTSVTIKQSGFDKFVKENPKLYKLIHVDMLRSLLKTAKQMKESNIETRPIQSLFERVFVEAFCLFRKEMYELYYQGMTDALEVVFYVNLNRENCKNLSQRVKYTDHSIDQMLGPIDEYFDCELNTVISQMVNVMKRIYQINKFQPEIAMRSCEMLRNYLLKYDPKLTQIIGLLNKRELDGILLKLMMSCGLHLTTSLQISLILTAFYLTKPLDCQAFLCQQLLSAAARACVPQHFNELDSYSLNAEFKQLELPGERVLDAQVIVTQAIDNFLTDDNELEVLQFIFDISERYSQYKIQDNLQVLATGGISGLAGLAFLGNKK